MFALLVLATSSRRAAAADPPKARTAPSFTLRGVAGPVCLDSLRGRVVVVDFWASWCQPCRRSFPWLDGVQKRYRDRGVVVVAIDLDRTREAADAFLAEHPADVTVAFDPTGRVAEAWHVAGMPSTFLVGRDGALLHAHVGFDERKAADLDHLIAEVSAR